MIIAALYVGTVIFEFHDVSNKIETELKRGFVDESQFIEYETPEWAMYVRAVGSITGLPLILLLSPFGGSDGAFVIAILLARFDVPIVFLFWFLLLCVVSYSVRLFGSKQNTFADPGLPQGHRTLGISIIFVACIVVIAGLTIGKSMYIAGSNKKAFESITPAYDNPVTLSLVNPNNGKEGDIITLQGSGFANKPLVAWLYDKQNDKYGFLWKGFPTDDSPISFPLKQTLCPTAFDPCGQSLRIFNTGDYFIKVGELDAVLPFHVNEDVVISNKKLIDIESFKEGVGGISGRFKGNTLTVDAVEGSYVWIWTPVNTSESFNYVEFEIAYDSVNSFSFGAFIDNKQIGSVSSEFAAGQKTQKFSAKIDEVSAGAYVLSFRLDSNNWNNRLVSSSMTLSDVTIGKI